LKSNWLHIIQSKFKKDSTEPPKELWLEIEEKLWEIEIGKYLVKDIKPPTYLRTKVLGDDKQTSKNTFFIIDGLFIISILLTLCFNQPVTKTLDNQILNSHHNNQISSEKSEQHQDAEFQKEIKQKHHTQVYDQPIELSDKIAGNNFSPVLTSVDLLDVNEVTKFNLNEIHSKKLEPIIINNIALKTFSITSTFRPRKQMINPFVFSIGIDAYNTKETEFANKFKYNLWMPIQRNFGISGGLLIKEKLQFRTGIYKIQGKYSEAYFKTNFFKTPLKINQNTEVGSIETNYNKKDLYFEKGVIKPLSASSNDTLKYYLIDYRETFALNGIEIPFSLGYVWGTKKFQITTNAGISLYIPQNIESSIYLKFYNSKSSKFIFSDQLKSPIKSTFSSFLQLQTAYRITDCIGLELSALYSPRSKFKINSNQMLQFGAGLNVKL